MFEVQVGFLVSPLARAGSILSVRFVADSLPEGSLDGRLFLGGIDGSNPVPSGKESATNLTGKIERALASGDTWKPT